MPIDILMPALSPTMTEGTLAKWLKKEGDNVAPGDVIAEIETDKATMEVEAVDEGKIGKILIPAGTAGVAVNTKIAVLLEDGEDSSAIKVSNMTARTPLPMTSAPSPQPSPQGGEGVAPAKKDEAGRIFASPLAKRLAAQKGIDLSAIKGSGPHGRIVKADLEKAPAAAPKSSTTLPTATPPEGYKTNVYGMAYKELPNNGIKKIVAKRLLESKQTVPHFYLSIECRLDALMTAREQINTEAKGAFKLSVNDFIIKACANALIAYPASNVSWTDDAVLQYLHADISVAVATPNSLITPIIKKAETKGLRQISEEMKELAGRARDGKLKPEEFQGGSFSISNLGMFGIKEFGAIINPPQACILAVGAGEQKPYVDGKDIKIGTFMTCTLSVDHRAVDGAVGAEYLQILKRYIENPISMLV